MIPVSLVTKSSAPADVLAVFAFEGFAPAAVGGLSGAQAKALAAQAEQDGFKGKMGDVYLTRWPGLRARKAAVIGLGKKASVDLEALRGGAAAAVKRCFKNHETIRFAVPTLAGVGAEEAFTAVAEGARLASYRYTKHRSAPEKEAPDLKSIELLPGGLAQAAAEKALARAAALSDAIAFVRDWVNEPPSHKRPELLGSQAETLAGPRVTVHVMHEEEIRERAMGGLLGVARGSSVPPVFIHLVYKGGNSKKKFAIVGKGITFDSGGLSLKPPQSMETMKMDMAGAATVLGVFKALAAFGVRAEVHGIAPVTYNMPGPDATKPGDVLTAMNGKTIEVLNTDAEGRLVLADALAFACKLGVDEIVDLATLTGAALIALGSDVTAAMTNDKAFLERFTAASKKAAEPVWELPLVESYKEGLKSKTADLQNISSVRGEAGTIIGGLFLQEFVDNVPWVHLDIAGTAWQGKDTSLCPAGGTGAMVRTLLEYLSHF